MASTTQQLSNSLFSATITVSSIQITQCSVIINEVSQVLKTSEV